MRDEDDAKLTCADARAQFSLLLYGELNFDQEENVEAHLDRCMDCRLALERHKELHAGVDELAVEPSAALLRECRRALEDRLAEETVAPAGHAGWWERFTDFLTSSLTSGPSVTWLKPAGALTLIALGFFGARVTPYLNGRAGANEMSMTDPGSAHVRYVEPGSDGRVHIVLDETRQRTIDGRMDDQQIRSLLLTAVKDPSDPGLRAETVDLLNGHAQSSEVRDALVFALSHDQNAGVRLKAMQGLKAFASEPEVRTALTQVLLTDNNPGLRTQAIDLLTAGASDTMDRQVIGTLQELMMREDNAYVRQRTEKILESVKASAQTY